MIIDGCRVIFGVSAGIGENINHPATLFKKNLTALHKIITSAEIDKIKRLCFIGSSCMFPLEAPQPYKESSLGTGAIEPTSSPYAYTKLAAWQLLRAINDEFHYQYFLAIPADIYGEPEDTHLIGDLIRKFHHAKEDGHKMVSLWGTGTPIRQPLFKGDLERIIKFLCKNYYEREPINIAPPGAYSVAHIARLIRDAVGFCGDISFDCAKPDGQMKKVLDNTKLARLGCTTFTPLEEGIRKTYERFIDAKRINLL